MSNIAFGARSSMPVRVRCAIRETRGDVNGADAAVQEAFAFVEKSGERFWLADWHRVGGQIALKQPEPDRAQAEACFLKAIEIARSQEARLLELRAGIDLARPGTRQVRPTTPVRCWSRSSPRSRAARARRTSATPARCWQRSGDQHQRSSASNMGQASRRTNDTRK